MAFEVVASKIQCFEAMQLGGVAMESTEVGTSGKICNSKGVPCTPESMVSSLRAQAMGKSTRMRSVAEENGGLPGSQNGLDRRFANLRSIDGEF